MTAEATDRSIEEFTEFCRKMERPLRYALVGQLGHHAGREAAQNALVYAWEHWDLIKTVDNPGGYLYRVGKRQALRSRRRRDGVPFRYDDSETPTVEPGLDGALERLSTRQRTVVMLVEGLGMTHSETAEVLGLTRSSVQTHLERALTALRRELGVIPRV